MVADPDNRRNHRQVPDVVQNHGSIMTTITSSAFGEDTGRWRLPLFAAAVLGSWCTEIKVPGIGIGIQNLLIPAAGLGLILISPAGAAATWRRHRSILFAVAALSGWALVSCAFALFPAFSLHAWVKFQVYVVAFAGFLCLLADADCHRRAFDLVIRALLVLAVLGVLEVVFPGSAFFRLFRSDQSLTIYPRVASVLPWPNQYGVLMGVGALLIQRRRIEGGLGRATSWFATLLLLTQVAQSGSRNAWLVLVLGLAWAAGRGILGLGRSLVVGVLFLAVVLVLPVSSRQTGLWDEPLVESTSFILRENEAHSTSLSPPGLSLSLRRQLWQEGWEELSKHPITGIGLDAFPRTGGVAVMGRQSFNTHNLALNIAVELGLVGLVLALVVAARLVRRRNPNSRLAEMALVMMLGAQVLDCFVYDAAYMTLGCFFAAALVTPSEEIQ